jgi:tape measure domain-containing protein
MAAPQLRLEVSLNLTGFRAEVQKLTNIAQSEFAPKINVKFNRQTLDTELNNLQAAIKRRVYRVEIGGNIDALPDKIKALKEQLSSLESFKIDLGIGAVKSLSKKDASKIKSDLRAEILGEQTKIYVPVSIKPSITREDVRNFKNTVKSKLTGLSVDVKANVQGGGTGAGLPPDFMKYMAEQGLLGKTASGMTMRMGKDGGDIKQQLSDAVGSAEKIKSIFDGVAQSIATTGKSIANVQGKRLGLANIPLMAGAMEKRIERSASAIEGTASFDALKSLYPEINKTIVSLAALRGQVQQNTSKLSSFSLVIGLAAFAGVPLAKSIVKLTGSADKFSKLLDKLGPNLEAAFTKAAFNILNTASSRLLTGGSAAGLLPPAYRGIGPSAEPAGLLPPAYRGIGPSRNAGALPPAYRGLPFGFDFKGLPPDASAEDQAGGLGPTVQQMRQQLFSSIRIAEVRVREIFDIVGDFDSRQKAAGQAKLDKAVQDFVKGLEDITRRAILRGGVRQVNVRDLGRMGAPMLGGIRTAGFLPAGVGRSSSPYSTGRLGREGETRADIFARREREARMRSALRGVDIMGEGGIAGRSASPYSYAYRGARPQSAIVPYSAGGAIVPVASRGGGGGGGGGGTGGGPGNFAGRGGGPGGGFNMPNLPGAGLVREIGQEFAFATKQVLLFGTAYKALAFATNFPAQVGQAVAALQSFNNTLKAISPSAKEVQASNDLILQLVDKYNIPLQSARDGFTKLYASMQSAGFAGNEVRDIFTGISKAAATFGMSADKVDRVNYAFAQMASKGQVMSEELKGQLGDVLPGALGIFAEAAGLKGPDAIQKFSAALEDGAYKGQAMKQLLTNVGVVMNKEFGPGAEGAARTFQGAINRMQNSLLFLYEAFEPAAVQFLNAVVMPLTNGIKQVTDGFNAFVTGQAAKTAGGSALAQQLNELKPSFEGILNNIKQLTPTFQLLGSVLLGVAKAFTVIIGSPIVGFLAKLYANVLLVNGVFTLLGGKILISLIGNTGAAIARFIALNAAVATMQRTAAVTNSTLAGTQLQMALLQRSAGMATGPVILLRNALLGLANMGLIVIGINVVINGLAELDRLKNSLAEIGTFSSSKYKKEISSMSKEDINSRLIENRRTQKAIQGELGGYAGPVGSAKGLVTGRDEELRARLLMVQAKEQALIRANKTARAGVSLDSQVAGGVTPVDLGAGGGAGAAPGKGAGKLDTYNRSTLEFIQQQGELEQQSLDRKRQQNLLSETQYKIDSASLALEITKKEEAEKLRLATLATNKDNLSSGDKALKLTDLQTAYQNNLAIAQDKYTTAVDGARKELSGPFDSAIKDTNASMVEQRMLLGNLQNGIEGLTPDQQAYLKVVEMTRDLSQDETDIIKDKINLLRGAIEQQILLNQEVEQGKILNELGGQLRLAQTLDPRAELRETLRQRNPLFSDAKIEEQALLSEQVTAAQKAKDDLKNIASTIGNAFGEAFKGIITGTGTVREALGGLFQSIADSFADMVAQMIAEWLKAQLIKGFLSLFPGFNGGGLSNLSAPASIGNPLGDLTGVGAKYANGGITPGGFQAFANGGVVTGPTLGLVGEGRYNEAVIPLPDGKSVPVQLSGGDGGNQINSNITVNVSNGQAQSNATGSNSSELGRKIEGAVKQVIVGELRPGGLLASR